MTMLNLGYNVNNISLDNLKQNQIKQTEQKINVRKLCEQINEFKYKLNGKQSDLSLERRFLNEARKFGGLFLKFRSVVLAGCRGVNTTE